MVGFGSSLRMGRRSGWEAAYLDYETLKLLLSQIESVYEEEGHHNHAHTNDSRDVFGVENSDDQNHHGRPKARRDYRDELFLESDSDAAFASSQSDEESSDTFDRAEGQEWGDGRAHHHHPQGGLQRFSLMGSYSSEDSGSPDDDTAGQCGGVPWRKEKKKDAAKVGKRRQRRQLKQLYQDDNDYYVPTNRDSAVKSFFVNEDSDTFDPSSKTSHSGSLFNAPFHYNNMEGGSSESTALLGFANAPRGNHDYFGTNSSTVPLGDKTPPRQNFGQISHQHSSQGGLPFGNAPANTTPRRPSQTKQEKWEEERRRARKQRRRRRLARKRREREKKVPPHIRIAHSKARSITERFLGLLRAEVEKVTLFAQARLGELADTAGSLRFLSSEDLTEMTEGFVARASSTAYDHHPLSDGGIHPSASSSSDEGAAGGQGGGGSSWWSDSSSDENDSHGSNPFPQPLFSGGGASPEAAIAAFGAGSRKPSAESLGMRKEDQVCYQEAKRKIEHFQELRQDRPIFQRNDHIVGEDLLLVSAVDEADAYSAVGVELLHILKYICVNVIAVRKICRKHDRLLQNRMLGGYYHRKRTIRAQEEQTLGGLIAHVAGDIYEARPALIGLVNHGKLMGVYDLKIQQLANSRTVKVVSSCLALALSEYEVSQTRADALATLTKSEHNDLASGKNRDSSPNRYVSIDFNATNWVSNAKDRLSSPCREGGVDSVLSDDERGSGPPSTTSSVSLARLRFTVLSIAALREASRIKANLFATYLSRSTLSFTGQAVVGEGLDGCSRETLDFLVYYSPDAALLLDSGMLYEGLRRGRWGNLSIATVMRSALAVALRGGRSIQEEEQIVINALSILPKSEGLDPSAPLEGRALPIATNFSISRFVDIPPGLLRCNRYSLFLYTVNYYIVHPTAVTFVDATGANAAYSAAIIGATSFAAILAAIVHCNMLTVNTNAVQGESNSVRYKGFLIFSAISAILGNVIQARGISRLSIPIVLLGRLFIGLGAADIVHRQFVVGFLHPSLIVSESARLVQFQATGFVVGLLIGSLAELAPYRSVRYGVQSLQVGNWIMVAFWIIHLFRLLLSTRSAKSQKNNAYQPLESHSIDKVDYIATGHSSDSSDSDPTGGGPVRLFHQPPGMRNREKATNENALVPQLKSLERSLRRAESVNHQRPKKRKVMSLMKRLRKLMAYNIAVPVTLALIVYTIFAQEVLFTSCALIADRYFAWRGNIAGFFLACLAFMILPVDFVCEQIARRYEERTTIKRSMLLLVVGILVMVNWGSVFAMVVNLKILFTETKDMRHHYYDWLLGIPQYVIGFIVTFAGLKALEGASRSLLSKVSPPNLRNMMTNVGTVVTLVGLVAQFLANVQIVAVGLSHRVINTDIVNSLVMPLLIGWIVAYYFVRKHYFFLM